MLISGYREPVDEAGEEVHATFLVYFADAVLLQHLIYRCTFFIDQVVGRDMFRVQCDSLRQIMFPAFCRFSGQSIDEVNADVSESCFPAAFYGSDRLCRCVPKKNGVQTLWGLALGT